MPADRQGSQRRSQVVCRGHVDQKRPRAQAPPSIGTSSTTKWRRTAHSWQQKPDSNDPNRPIQNSRQKQKPRTARAKINTGANGCTRYFLLFVLQHKISTTFKTHRHENSHFITTTKKQGKAVHFIPLLAPPTRPTSYFNEHTYAIVCYKGILAMMEGKRVNRGYGRHSGRNECSHENFVFRPCCRGWRRTCRWWRCNRHVVNTGCG